MHALQLDHIGIAVADMSKAERFFREVLGLTEERSVKVARYGLNAKFFRLGDISVELMEPIDEAGPVYKHLKRYGPSVQHVAVKVADLPQAKKELQEKKVWLLEGLLQEEEKKLAELFIHPVVTGGLLVELVE
jgi:methylmalonyl-CoA epimerase